MRLGVLGQAGEGVDGEAGAHDDDEVGHGGEVARVAEGGGEGLAEEDDVGLDEPAAFLAVGDDFALDVVEHVVVRVGGVALDAALGGEAAVGLDDLVCGDAGAALEAVDVLGEVHEEDALLGEEGDEGVGDGGVEFARVEFLGEVVEGLRVFAKIGNVKDGFAVG